MRFKAFFLLVLIFFLYGCSQNEKKNLLSKEIVSQEEPTIEVSSYQDENDTPISFYTLHGNTLNKCENITGEFQAMDDIGLFQVYPSREDTIFLSNNFASSFYHTWNSYLENHSLKIGFSLSFSIDRGEDISYLILSPTNTMEYWEYFLTYLYDDYANLGKSFYSHMEENEYNDLSLFTAFKLQCGPSCQKITTPVKLEVFTYDGEDDSSDGKYRGNSLETLLICLHSSCF